MLIGNYLKPPKDFLRRKTELKNGMKIEKANKQVSTPSNTKRKKAPEKISSNFYKITQEAIRKKNKESIDSNEEGGCQMEEIITDVEEIEKMYADYMIPMDELEEHNPPK